jgi:hypothetical protein
MLLVAGNGTLPATGTFLLPLHFCLSKERLTSGTANQLATANFNLVPDLGRLMRRHIELIPVNGTSNCGPELSHLPDANEHCVRKVPHTLLATLSQSFVSG